MNFIKYILEETKNNLSSQKFIYSMWWIILLLWLWQIASLFIHKIMLASPYQTFSTLIEMFGRSTFWEAVWITANRAIVSIILWWFIGFIFGVMAWLNSNIKNLLEPIRWMIMSISPIIVVSIAMMWFWMGTQMVIFIASLLLAPIVYVNTIKWIQMVDEKIIEMANVYKFNIFEKLIHIYIPALIWPLSAAMTIVVTAWMRMIILAEVLWTNSGIWYEFSFTKSDMNTPELFAWVVVTLIFVWIAEYLIFKPLENYLLRWKK